MDIVGSIVVFVVLWWLIFFMTLPFGLQRGSANEHGAPARPLLLRKIIVTSVAAFLLTALAYWLVAAGLLNLREVFDPS